MTVSVLETGNYTIHSGLDYVVSYGYWDEWRWITGTGTDILYLIKDVNTTIQLAAIQSVHCCLLWMLPTGMVSDE